MNGEDLFNLWAEAMANQSIDVGEWADMEPTEAEAWDATATQVRPGIDPPR